MKITPEKIQELHTEIDMDRIKAYLSSKKKYRYFLNDKTLMDVEKQKIKNDYIENMTNWDTETLKEYGYSFPLDETLEKIKSLNNVWVISAILFILIFLGGLIWLIITVSVISLQISIASLVLLIVIGFLVSLMKCHLKNSYDYHNIPDKYLKEEGYCYIPLDLDDFDEEDVYDALNNWDKIKDDVCNSHGHPKMTYLALYTVYLNEMGKLPKDIKIPKYNKNEINFIAYLFVENIDCEKFPTIMNKECPEFVKWVRKNQKHEE